MVDAILLSRVVNWIKSNYTQTCTQKNRKPSSVQIVNHANWPHAWFAIQRERKHPKLIEAHNISRSKKCTDLYVNLFSDQWVQIRIDQELYISPNTLPRKSVRMKSFTALNRILLVELLQSTLLLYVPNRILFCKHFCKRQPTIQSNAKNIVLSHFYYNFLGVDDLLELLLLLLVGVFLWSFFFSLCLIQFW